MEKIFLFIFFFTVNKFYLKILHHYNVKTFFTFLFFKLILKFKNKICTNY